jgi:hypothetical protein
MLFEPNVAGLQVALAGLPDDMRVVPDPDIVAPARTVGELRNVASWPENFVIATPAQSHPGSTVNVSKASHAARVSPKP